MSRGKSAKITWGTSFANTLNIYHVDDAIAYSEPREGYETAKAPSGEEDSWVIADEEFLAFVARWIPMSNSASPLATGWDGATGFNEFLKWARAKNIFRWFGDVAVGTYKESLLVEPLRGSPQLESDMTRAVHMVIRSTDDTAYTGY